MNGAPRCAQVCTHSHGLTRSEDNPLQKSGGMVCPSLGRPGAGWGARGNPNDARQVKAGKVCELESL